MRLLVTGRPGSGKTTLVRRLLEAGIGPRVSGFLTEEIRGPQGRTGFRVVAIGGDSAVLARAGGGRPRVGRYAVDLPAFERVALPTLEPGQDVDLYVLDEIGKMECLSPRFVAALERLLDSGAPLLATIARRGTGFIEGVKSRPDVEVVHLDASNRDALAGEIRSRWDARGGNEGA